MPHAAEYVPAEPFANWLNARLAQILANEEQDLRSATLLLATECGWGSSSDGGVRKMYRMRKRLMSSSLNGRKQDLVTDRFPRDTVEEALFSAGVPFEDVYPEIAAREEVVLEPSEWCWPCGSVVTPIGGFCPWCEAQVSEATGQRLMGSRLKDAA